MDFKELKRYLIFNLIGSLILAALVGVITVLFGEFGDIHAKVFLTLLMVVVHSIISLVFIWDDAKQNTFKRLNIFMNVLFILVIISFITSLFGIWEIIAGKIIWYIYQTFFVVAFATLHAETLSKAQNKERYMDTIIYINYIFMAIVVIMLLPLIFTDNARDAFSEIFFRILGAAAIIDGTLSILTIIFYKIFTNKHPKTEYDLQKLPTQISQKKNKKGLSTWVWVLIIFLSLQIILPVILLAMSYLSSSY